MIPALTDPLSGQPEARAAAVSVQPYAAAWYGFAVSAEPVSPQGGYWATALTTQGWRVELAAATLPENWETYARALFQAPDAEAVSLTDAARGIARVALTEQGVLRAALFISPGPVAVARTHLAGLVGQACGFKVLAGRAGADRPDPGPTICACLNVGLNTLTSAIATRRLLSVAQIGEALGAGTNCGSCRPEPAALLSAQLLLAAE